VVIHGGFWKAAYDLSLGRPLAPSLLAQGWAVANVEYRRVGDGGGWPATFDDVAAALDSLADVPALGISQVVTLGHSAGGHLAVWAAALGRSGQRPARVAVTAAVSQAGVLDLAAAERDQLGSGAVAALLGADRPAPALVDPSEQLPLDVPVWCVHGADDDEVPLSQSTQYVARARAAGTWAELFEVDGDHYVVIDPESAAWRRTLEILDAL
jgi:acetyl esterase/lipase